jgi:hypothetical protein
MAGRTVHGARCSQQVAEEEFGKVYGEDYVFLGFRPGNEAVVKGIVSNIRNSTLWMSIKQKWMKFH